MKHGGLAGRAAGPTGRGPQEQPSALLPPDLPPGSVYYEHTDVKTRPVTKALLGLVVATALVAALVYPAFLWLRGRVQRSDPPPPPMGRHEPGRLPAEPRLQTTPLQDLAATRTDDGRLLTTYGWVDEERGIVHIPIEEAMRKIAERGLPAATASPAAAGTGTAGSPAAPPGAASPAPSASPEARR